MSKKKWNEFNRVGRAQFAFTPQEGDIGKYQMKLKKDDTVVILSENSGWYKGHLKDKPEVHGMFPANYVKLLDESDTARCAVSRYTVASGGRRSTGCTAVAVSLSSSRH